MTHPSDEFLDAKKRFENRVEEEQKRAPMRSKRFSTWSDHEVPLISTPEDLEKINFDYVNDLGFPGEYPFTRGVHSSMYRGKLWTFRQFAGFATPSKTNERFKLLLENGQTGLSVAFDMPTLMGYDCDSPKAKGEVGKCGVAVSSLADMEELFAGIPLDKVTTSMTINGPAIVLLMMYFAVAKKQGLSPSQVGGTLQNDILKEYIAQKEWLFPIRPAVKLVVDTLEYCTEHYPKWNSISISGYHIREAGATAIQELAFTLADGFAYVEECLKRGMDIDEFAPRLSFFFDVHNDFFEEIAKFRAARRIWAKRMRHKYGAKNPKSWMLRTHAQTAGVSLTAQQPYNNIVRVTVQALAAVLGGTNSLHTNSMDETLALPTDEAVMIALRTQQIIAEESGVANVVDPFGGSYFIERLTKEIEDAAEKYFEEIEKRGGMISATDEGYPQSEIANSAYEFQKLLESKQKKMVGVNAYQMVEPPRKLDILSIGPEIQRAQIEKLNRVKSTRSSQKVSDCLERIKEAAKNNENLCPVILEAVEAYATVQEVCDALRSVYGEYRETSGRF